MGSCLFKAMTVTPWPPLPVHPHLPHAFCAPRPLLSLGTALWCGWTPVLPVCVQWVCPASGSSFQGCRGQGQSGIPCSLAAPQGCREAQSRAPHNHSEVLWGRERDSLPTCFPQVTRPDRPLDRAWTGVRGPTRQAPNLIPHPSSQGRGKVLRRLLFKRADRVEEACEGSLPGLGPARAVAGKPEPLGSRAISTRDFLAASWHGAHTSPPPVLGWTRKESPGRWKDSHPRLPGRLLSERGQLPGRPPAVHRVGWATAVRMDQGTGALLCGPSPWHRGTRARQAADSPWYKPLTKHLVSGDFTFGRD